MSSYTIAKQEYMKAAGVISGLASEIRDFWIYDYETRRNSTPEDYKRHFTEMFTMNALSVKEQYHGDEVGAPSTDSNEYNDLFNEYMHLGKQIAYNGGKVLENAIYELMSFFGSALYQTENDAYMFKMQFYFNNLIVALFKQGLKRETKSWGTLEIEKPEHIYQSLF